MSLAQQYDYVNTLRWIKGELDETLNQARQCLEEFVEHPSDGNAMEDAVYHLHLTKGTLQMLELFGASLLAEEMYSVASGLAKGSIERRDDACEVLMRAILQLPDYLERLKSGYQDVPLVLLPLMNDLRAARDASLLSEGALFSPDLNIKPQIKNRKSDAQAGNIKELARKLRSRYQFGLVGWYKNSKDMISLKRLDWVLTQFEQHCREDDVARLFWVANGVVEGIMLGGIESNISVKLLLGKVDWEIKRLVDGGESEVAKWPAKDLLKNLLYYLGRADCQGQRVNQLQAAFKISQFLPKEEELNEARASIGGANAKLMETVTSVITEDLTKIEDSLDLFMRAENRALDRLMPIIDSIGHVTDTLGMLGQGNLRLRLVQQAEILQGMLEGDVELDDQHLLKVAETLIFVKTALSDVHWYEGQRKLYQDDMPDAEAQPTPDFQNVRKTVIGEALGDLLSVKEDVIDFIQGPMNFSALESVPTKLEAIRGAMSVIQAPRISNLVANISKYVSTELLENQHAPSTSEQDLMADPIAGVEYVLETMAEDRPVSGPVLDFCESSMAKLGYPISRPREEMPEQTLQMEEFAESEMESAPVESVEIEDVAVDFDESQINDEDSLIMPLEEEDEPSVQMDMQTDEMELSEVEDSANDEVVVEDEIDQFAESETQNSSEAMELEEEANWQPESDGVEEITLSEEEDVDDEIVEVFMEEADEELITINENYPRWRADQNDIDALKVTRRSFHTLKGSGRLVGAHSVGEFAWAVENLLNRVIDGSRPADTAVFKLMDDVLATLPELIKTFKEARGDVPATEKVIAIQELAHQLADPHAQAEVEFEEVESVEANFEDGEEQEEELVLSEPENEIEIEEITEDSEIDEVLYDIFKNEAKTHLSILEEFVSQDKEEYIIDDVIMRALHTLHGSAHMAGFSDIAEVSGALENYIIELGNHSLHLGPQGAQLLAHFVQDVKNILPKLTDNHGALSHVNEQIHAVENLHEGLHKKSVAEEEKPIEVLASDYAAQEMSTSSDESVSEEEELRDIFLTEAAEIMDNTDHILQQWAANPDDKNLQEQLERELHTFKGGARLAGFSQIGDLTHELETVLSSTRGGRLPVTNQLLDLVHKAYDRLAEYIENIRHDKALSPATDILSEISYFAEHKGQLPVDDLDFVPQVEIEIEEFNEGETQAPETRIEPTTDDVDISQIIPMPDGVSNALSFITQDKELTTAEVSESILEQKKTGPVEQIRVRADMLDKLVNYAAEVSISRSRMEQHVGTFRHNLTELQQTVERVREQLRRLDIETEAQILYRHEEAISQHGEEFDPLEFDRYSTVQQLSRSLGESVSDLVNIRDNLDNLTGESEALLLQQARVNTELQEGLMRTRLVSFAGMVPRLRRVIRQTARELDKEVELNVKGADVELDKNVLDRMAGPLEHVLRNAIDHGIEIPKQRKKAKKAEKGTITIHLNREGSEVVIDITDDGQGIDLKSIRKKAEDQGLIQKGADLTDNDILQFILEAGFSTASKVTQISGRGVGLDVVSNEIKQLGGTLQIDTAKDQGSKFSIRLPLTLSISQSLIVEIGDEMYAVPLSSIMGITRIRKDELNKILEQEMPLFQYAGNDYHLQNLGRVLGVHAYDVDDELTKFPLLLVHSSGHLMAFQVDNLLGSREIVVKSVGPQLTTIRGLAGATIMGDGRVVLILDMAALIRKGVVADAVPEKAAIEEDRSGVSVMVVDDSITVRKVTSRFLERHHMGVVTAKDGVDALGKLQENLPDVILLDIEMPRMDGYELASVIRNDARLQHIPIIMITSRTGAKHRDRAKQIGVDIYMGKPYQEHELIENINSLIRR